MKLPKAAVVKFKGNARSIRGDLPDHCTIIVLPVVRGERFYDIKTPKRRKRISR